MFNGEVIKVSLGHDVIGEYFAVKEQKLFGWDQHTVDGGMLREMTASEKQEQHHFDWHLCWKGGKVHKTTVGLTALADAVVAGAVQSSSDAICGEKEGGPPGRFLVNARFGGHTKQLQQLKP